MRLASHSQWITIIIISRLHRQASRMNAMVLGPSKIIFVSEFCLHLYKIDCQWSFSIICYSHFWRLDSIQFLCWKPVPVRCPSAFGCCVCMNDTNAMRLLLHNECLQWRNATLDVANSYATRARYSLRWYSGETYLLHWKECLDSKHAGNWKASPFDGETYERCA